MEKSIDDTVMEARPVLNCTTSVNMTSGMPSIKDRLVAFEKRAALTANANCLRENLKIPLAAVPSLRDRLQSFERSEAATMANGRRRAFAMPSCDDAQSVGDRLRAFKRFSDSPRAVGQQSATAIMSPAAAPELERRVKALKASLGVGRLDKVWPPKCVARVCTDKSRNRSNAVEKVSGAVTCSSRAENAGERAMKTFKPVGSASLGGGEIDRANVTRETEPANGNRDGRKGPDGYTENMKKMAMPKKIKPKLGSVMKMVNMFDQKRK